MIDDYHPISKLILAGEIITAEFAVTCLVSKSGGGKNFETSLFRQNGSK
jgi:hypothetical protein